MVYYYFVSLCDRKIILLYIYLYYLTACFRDPYLVGVFVSIEVIRRESRSYLRMVDQISAELSNILHNGHIVFYTVLPELTGRKLLF